MQGKHADSTADAGGGQTAPAAEGVAGAADLTSGGPHGPPGPPGLFAFTPLSVPRRHQDVVRRHAVLVPLMGPGGDAQKILDQVGRLIVQRRARLFALAGAGLPEVSGGEPQSRRLRYALNCKPSFVITKEQVASCNLAFCPFCWARWVYEVWVQVEHAFFADAPPGGPSPRDLIYRSATKPVPAQVPDREGKPRDGLVAYVDERIRSRNRPHAQFGARSPGVTGGFEMLHVNPGGEGGWDVNVRQVLMALPEAPDPAAVPAEDYRYERTQGPGRLAVRNAVALATRYSTFLMRGDPTVAVRYLAARRRRQISAMTGEFRNKAARPPDNVPAEYA